MRSPSSDLAEKARIIQSELRDFVDAGDQVFISSSFQNHSIPLLHIIAGCEFDIPVVFIDTGYHFPQTLRFVRQVAADFSLDLYTAKAHDSKLADLDSSGNLMFVADPDGCCNRNKVRPLDPWLETYDIWVSGLRGDQSAFRSGLSRIQPGPFGTQKFLPLIDWTWQEVGSYRELHDLPAHPLDPDGLLSIGCQPCTDMEPINLGMPGFMNGGDSRGNRWLGMRKTECGLHLPQTQERQISQR